MVTSKHLGFYLSNELKSEGINVIFYHGNDEKTEEFKHLNGESEYMSHINVKKQHFKNVNNYWKDYDVVLHNSTITAGVSFDDEDYFDV